MGPLKLSLRQQAAPACGHPIPRRDQLICPVQLGQREGCREVRRLEIQPMARGPVPERRVGQAVIRRLAHGLGPIIPIRDHHAELARAHGVVGEHETEAGCVEMVRVRHPETDALALAERFPSDEPPSLVFLLRPDASEFTRQAEGGHRLWQEDRNVVAETRRFLGTAIAVVRLGLVREGGAAKRSDEPQHIVSKLRRCRRVAHAPVLPDRAVSVKQTLE